METQYYLIKSEYIIDKYTYKMYYFNKDTYINKLTLLNKVKNIKFTHQILYSKLV